MIKFLITERYNFIDIICQAFMVWGIVTTGNWAWILIVFPFAVFNALMQSIERVNNGNKK